MKRLGFLTGAVLAGIGVFLFNQWRHVSDDDRLIAVLADHCLPYVQAGEIPFQDIGRSPGVYDAIDVDERLQNGGARLIYDLRFMAQWGETEDADGPVRVCRVDPTYGENTVAAFEVDPDGFVERYTDVLSVDEPLIPQADAVTTGPTVFGWYGGDRPQDEGLRVVFGVSPGLVSSVLVGRDLP